MFVVGHGIRTNPQIIHAVEPKLENTARREAWPQCHMHIFSNSKILPNSVRIVSPLQLGAMSELHAMYRVLVMHNLLKKTCWYAQ